MADLSKLFTNAVAGIRRDRQRALDAQEQIALGQQPGQQPVVQAEAPPEAAPGMSQSAFFKGYTPEERAQQQRKLAQMLRQRQ